MPEREVWSAQLRRSRPEGEHKSAEGTATKDRDCTACAGGYFQNQNNYTGWACKRRKTCNPNDEYQSNTPSDSKTTDRQCATLTPCEHSKYQTKAPQKNDNGKFTSNYTCGTLTTCQQGEYEKTAPKTANFTKTTKLLNQAGEDDPRVASWESGWLFTSDRTCATLTACEKGQYDKNAVPTDGTSKLKRDCRRLTKCGANQYDRNAVRTDGTATSDRQCTNLTPCDSFQYLTKALATDGTSNYACAKLTPCQAGEYETRAPTLKHATQPWSSTNPYITNRECLLPCKNTTGQTINDEECVCGTKVIKTEARTYKSTLNICRGDNLFCKPECAKGEFCEHDPDVVTCSPTRFLTGCEKGKILGKDNACHYPDSDDECRNLDPSKPVFDSSVNTKCRAPTGGGKPADMPAAATAALVQSLINAGFDIGTVHAKMSGPPEARGKRLYKVQSHVADGFFLEYCREGRHANTSPGGTGWTAYGATKESCTTTDLRANFYNQGNPEPVTYSLKKGLEKEAEANASSSGGQSASQSGGQSASQSGGQSGGQSGQQNTREEDCNTWCNNNKTCYGVAYTKNKCWFISHQEKTGDEQCRDGKRMFNRPDACWREKDLAPSACDNLCKKDSDCLGSKFVNSTSTIGQCWIARSTGAECADARVPESVQSSDPSACWTRSDLLPHDKCAAMCLKLGEACVESSYTGNQCVLK